MSDSFSSAYNIIQDLNHLTTKDVSSYNKDNDAPTSISDPLDTLIKDDTLHLISYKHHLLKNKPSDININTCCFWIIFHPRTERAFRTILFFIPALLFSYYGWIETNLQYSCALLYALMAALIPPMMYGISVVGMMAFPAGLIGTCFCCAVWAIGSIQSEFSSRWAMFLLYILLVIFVSPWKIGKTASITNMAALMAVYSSELPFFIGFRFMENGFNIKMPTRQMIELLPNLSKLIPQDSVLSPQLISTLIMFLKNTVSIGLQNGETFTFKIVIPPELGQVENDLEIVTGWPIIASINQTILNVYIPSGLRFIRLAWNGYGKVGIIRAILMYGGTALGLFICSLLIPPQRYLRSYLRLRVSAVSRELGSILQLMFIKLNLINYEEKKQNKDLESYDIINRFPVHLQLNEQHFLVHIDTSLTTTTTTRPQYFSITDVNESQQNKIKELDKNTKSLLQDKSISLNSHERTTKNNYKSSILTKPYLSKLRFRQKNNTSSSNRSQVLYPTPEEGENELRHLMSNDYFNTNITCSPETIDEAFRQEILTIESIKPMIIVSAMEPSLSNPGLLVNYVFNWIGIIRSLRFSLVHSKALWDIAKPIKPIQETKKNNVIMQGPSPYSETLNENDMHLDEYRHIDIFKETDNCIHTIMSIVLEIYIVSGDIIGLRPVSRGSGVVTATNLRCRLEIKIRQLRIMKHILFKKINLKQFILLNNTMDWKIIVKNYICFIEFKSAIIEAPEQLAIAVDSFIQHETIFNLKTAIILNCAGFFLPLLSMIGVAIKSFVLLFIPWTWRWKKRQYHHKYLGTGQRWFENTDFWFLFRWVLGVACLLSLPIFWDEYRTWLVSGEDNDRPLNHLLADAMTTKLSSWASLGFLTTIFMTVEGTIHRAGLRAIGVITGTFSAFCCLHIFGSKNMAAHIIWLVITVFLACWIGGNSVSAVLGYDPSWGYAAQLFTYQETIIIVEAYHTIQTRDELIASRLFAQLIGILTACIISTFIMPDQANITIQQCSVQALYCYRESVIALVESLIVSETDEEFVSDAREWEEAKKSTNMFQSCLNWKRNVLEDAPTDPLTQKKKFLFKRSERYQTDGQEALDKIFVHVKDSTVFRELPLCSLEPRWHDASLSLQLMYFHRDAFTNMASAVSAQNDNSSPISKTKLINVLEKIKELSHVIESHLGNEVTSVFSSYNANLLINFLGCLSCAKRRRSVTREKMADKILTDFGEHLTALNDAVEQLGQSFSLVVKELEQQVPTTELNSFDSDTDKPVDNPNLDSTYGLPKNVHIWFTTTYFILKYTEDMQYYVNAVMGVDKQSSQPKN